MKRLESKDLDKLGDTDLIKRLNDLRSEFSKLKSGAARGTLKKELGEIKTVRRNIARVLTVVNSRKKNSSIAKTDGKSQATTKKQRKEEQTKEEASSAAKDSDKETKKE